MYEFRASLAKINILGLEKNIFPRFFLDFPKKKVTLRMIARSFYRSVYRMGVKCPNSKVFLEEIRLQKANALPTLNSGLVLSMLLSKLVECVYC